MTAGADDITRVTPAPGSSFGPYQIVASLGAGGMGEVYRARDSKLGREVALKFLPEELSSDEGLLARFDREAKLLALVNHPNIATIHSIEEAHGKRFLVLELVEGKNLADVLGQAPLPLHQALKSSRDIAEALEAAHRKGIVHRDLKPANVILTPDMHVKVLDFGIAKPVAYGLAASNLAAGSTPSGELTATGALVGTGPYMSPEQVRGQEAGRRADIWSFGCLMFQMLTGEPAFGRDTLADTLTSILEREPDWSRLPAKTPESVIRLMKRCLQKDPAQRLQHIGDARIEIDEAIRTPSGATASATAAGVTLPWWQIAAGFVLMLAIGVAAGSMLASIGAGEAGPPPPEGVFGQQLLPDTMLDVARAPSIAVSRDGQRLVMALNSSQGLHLYRRALDRNVVEQIPGTEGAEAPFLSPDGTEVGFFAQGQLHQVAFDGVDAPTPLCEAPDPQGGTWGDDGNIYFSASQELFSVAAGGGGETPLEIIGLEDAQMGLRWPHVLPGGDLLFTVWNGYEDRGTSIYRRAGNGEVAHVLDRARQPQYVAGHLLFARGDEIWAVRFDDEVRKVGSEVQFRQGAVTDKELGVSHFAVASERGSMIWLEGGELDLAPLLAFVDPSGASAPTPVRLNDRYDTLSHPRLSPNRRHALVSVQDDEAYFIGTANLAAGGALQPDRDPERNLAGAEWLENGGQRVYSGSHLIDSDEALFLTPVSATSEPQRLLAVAGEMQGVHPTSVSSENLLLYTVTDIDTTTGTYTAEVWMVGLNGNSTPAAPFLDKAVRTYHATFSADGNLIAFVSNQMGEANVWVTNRDIGDTRPTLVSGANCDEPVWGAGETLYYRCGTEMMATEISSEDLSFSVPRRVFSLPFARDAGFAKANYDVDPDSGRFLMVSDEPIITAREITWRLSITDELAERTGAAGTGR